MKLIIDIPHEDYYIFKSELGKGNLTALAEIVANGIPYEPKGDLISREALLKALKSNCKPEICHDYGTNWCEACCPHNDFEDLIDNAPTVSPSLNLDNITEADIEKFKIIWQRANSKGLSPIIEDRPQGKPVIKCHDCKYQVKEWREDKRMKDKGYWVYGCEHFGEIMGYWGFGGNDNEFCSDAEQKGGKE